MAIIRTNLFPLSLLLLIPLVSLFYDELNNAQRGVNSLATDIDHSIPLVEVFIIPYIIWYPFILGCMIYFCWKDRNLYYTTLASLLIGFCICYVCYYFFQTGIIRPLVTGTDILSRMIRFIYSSDQPYNCFPSIHCLSTYLMMKAINKSTFKTRVNLLFINGMGILIILSTLFVKQHVVLDAFSAVLLGSLLFAVISNLQKKWEKAQQKNRSQTWAIREKAKA